MQKDKENSMSYPTKITIIPDTRYSSQELVDKFKPYQEDAHSVSFAYLHGQLEDMVGFDLFSTLEPNEDLKEGIYDTDFDGQPCKFFWWATSYNQNKGLVVLCDDTQSMQYAQECYDRKASIL